MPLAKRIIPTLLVRGRQLFKGQQFQSWRSVGLAAQAVRIHQARGVDEIVICDISATAEGRGPDLSLIEELSDVLYCPLAVGGGVRTVADVKAILRAGGDKVIVCTAAQQLGRSDTGQEWVIKAMVDAVGSQAIVAAIDVKDGKVWTNSGTTVADDCGVAGNAALLAEWGAGEILLTSIEREGTLQGYDLDLIRAVSSAVSIPVIANGGCGTPQHALEAIEAGASAVGIGAMFLFSDHTPRSVAQYLMENNVEARV